ncbi:MAG: NAD(P)/FAD-dependent oxidoreductase, partial [Desulfotomaculaceae bacterium]|nr:NAD(P)/FAD-dependent oxidoreductase [Desulfotomaculaceae bacterium]
KPAGQITAAEHRKILKILKDWRFEITGTTSWPNAQVTAGGVDVKDINGRTLESKLVVGLYFAGEVLDIDGDCGGFNLQWAWSSGYVAGQSAAVGV